MKIHHKHFAYCFSKDEEAVVLTVRLTHYRLSGDLKTFQKRERIFSFSDQNVFATKLSFSLKSYN